MDGPVRQRLPELQMLPRASQCRWGALTLLGVGGEEIGGRVCDAGVPPTCITASRARMCPRFVALSLWAVGGCGGAV